MPSNGRIIGCHNALEISGSTARRYLVHAAVYEAGAIVHAEVANAPTETLELPLPRERAETWLELHFEDLAPADRREALDRLTRSAGAVGE